MSGIWHFDEVLKDCSCGASFCVPGMRRGPTIISYDTNSHRVICLNCWKKAQAGKTVDIAVSNWNKDKRNVLVRKRHDLGMTQQQLADHCGVSMNAIYRYEKGTQTPTDETRKKIESKIGKVW